MLRRAFRQVALLTHPDKVGESPEAKALFLAANEASQRFDLFLVAVIWLQVDRKGFLQMTPFEAEELTQEMIREEERQSGQRGSVAFQWATMSQSQKESFVRFAQ